MVVSFRVLTHVSITPLWCKFVEYSTCFKVNVILTEQIVVRLRHYWDGNLKTKTKPLLITNICPSKCRSDQDGCLDCGMTTSPTAAVQGCHKEEPSAWKPPELPQPASLKIRLNGWLKNILYYSSILQSISYTNKMWKMESEYCTSKTPDTQLWASSCVVSRFVLLVQPPTLTPSYNVNLDNELLFHSRLLSTHTHSHT